MTSHVQKDGRNFLWEGLPEEDGSRYSLPLKSSPGHSVSTTSEIGRLKCVTGILFFGINR